MVQDWRVMSLMLAGLLAVGLIMGVPLLHAIQLSFFNVENVVAEPRFVGFGNYTRVISDPNFWTAFINGLIISGASIALQAVLGIAIALVLNQHFAGQTLVRAIAVLPYLVPTVVACLTIQWLLDPNYGLVKEMLATFGLRMFDWGSKPGSAIATIVFVNVWLWTPFVVTCVLAGLQNIPKQLYEAATVDGAGAWRQFWHVTMPGLKSVLIVIILLRTIWMFNKFDVVWLMTKGGPLNSTETLPVLAYRKAFIEFNVGLGAAVATFSFLMLAFIISIYLRLFPLDETDRIR